MRVRRPSSLLSRLGVFCLFAAFAAAGCSGGPKLYTVKGKVLLDGQPLKGAAVSFIPDTAKGNTAKQGGNGMTDDTGEYTIMTGNKSGVASGWYKVTVQTSTPMGMPGGAPPPVADPTKGGGNAPNPPPLAGPSVQINQKFTAEATTTLAVEVVSSPAPGAYDLQVTK